MQTLQVEVSPEWGRRSLLVIAVYRYQGSCRRELSFSSRGWLPPLQTHFNAASMQQWQHLQGLYHTRSRGRLWLMGQFLLPGYYLSLQIKKSISQKKLFFIPDCARLTARSFCNAAVVLVPGLWYQLRKDLGRNWYVRVMEKNCGPVSMFWASRDVSDTEIM